jgi:hypothetical protein
MERRVVRGDTLRFRVDHGSSTAGWTPILELRQRPEDVTPLGSLTANDGIAGNGTNWEVEISESVSRSLCEAGKRCRIHYQLRAYQSLGDTVTLETGVLMIDPDIARVSDGWSDAVGMCSDQGGF